MSEAAVTRQVHSTLEPLELTAVSENTAKHYVELGVQVQLRHRSVSNAV